MNRNKWKALAIALMVVCVISNFTLLILKADVIIKSTIEYNELVREYNDLGEDYNELLDTLERCLNLSEDLIIELKSHGDTIIILD